MSGDDTAPADDRGGANCHYTPIVATVATPYADAAPGYLSLGWSPLPIPPGAKFPPPAGYTGHGGLYANGPDVYGWAQNGKGGHNVAIRLPDTVIGLDVDAYDGKQGEATMLEAIDRLGDLPHTYVSTSRDDLSGIRLYRVPQGRTWADRLGAGVEVVHHGHRYVMAPPSVHPNGAVYRCLGPDRDTCPLPAPGDLPDLPEAWVAELDRGSADEVSAKASVAGSEVRAFLREAPSGAPCRYVDRLVTEAVDGLTGAGSRHDHAREYVAKMVRAADQGHHGAGAALDTLHGAFLGAVAGEAGHDPGEWERLVSGAVGLVRAAPTAEKDKGCCGTQAADTPLVEFWGSRPVLDAVHGWARARMAAPPAVLAVVLARVIACTPPNVVLPPIIGGEVSLNLFFALVGNAGGGKGAAERAGAAAIDLGGVTEFRETSAGSGEGIAHLFMRRVKRTVEQHTEAALLSVPEVDTLAGLKHRQGSTLMPELRKAWMGERLGFAYADPSKALPVPQHRYRLNLLIGVQPLRAGVLVEDADGGTPQRLGWLTTTDPGMPDETPDPPPRIRWRRPTWPHAVHGLSVLPVCDTAQQVIRAAHLARQRGDGDALDGHALLCRLKVAAALGILDGRAEVNEQDWHLAGLVMEHSAATRQMVVDRLSRQRRESNVAQGEAEAVREVIKHDRVHDTEVQRASRAITRHLRRAGGWVNHGPLRRTLTGRLREHFEDAVDRLITAGQVEHETTVSGGQEVRRYRLIDGAE